MKLTGSLFRWVSVLKLLLKKSFWSELVPVSDTKIAAWETWKKVSVPELRKQLTPEIGIFKTCVISYQYLETRIMAIQSDLNTHNPFADRYGTKDHPYPTEITDGAQAYHTIQYHQPNQVAVLTNKRLRVAWVQKKWHKPPHSKTQASINNPSWQDSRAESHEAGRFPWWIEAIG